MKQPELAYYDWITFSDGDIHNFGRFLRPYSDLKLDTIKSKSSIKS